MSKPQDKRADYDSEGQVICPTCRDADIVRFVEAVEYQSKVRFEDGYVVVIQESCEIQDEPLLITLPEMAPVLTCLGCKANLDVGDDVDFRSSMEDPG